MSAPVQDESRGEVLHLHTEDGARVETAAAAQEATPQAPVLRPAARHVARADDHVVALGLVEHRGEYFGSCEKSASISMTRS